MQKEQQVLIQQSFEKILTMSDIAGGLFYSRLFVLKPRLKRLFTGDIITQRRKLIDMLRMVVRSVDQWGVIAPRLQQLGQRHVQYGVQPEDYAIVGQALIWMLEECLGKDFDAATKAAWLAFYDQIAAEMQVEEAHV